MRADLRPARVLDGPAALARMLRNLLDNAVRHARSPGHKIDALSAMRAAAPNPSTENQALGALSAALR